MNFKEFLDGLVVNEESASHAGLYVAEYFKLEEYITIFTDYVQKIENDEIVENDEGYDIYIKMLSQIELLYPSRYKKMNEYIDHMY